MTATEIEAGCGRLAAAVAQFRRDRRLEDLYAAHGELRALRESYRESPADFAPHLARLREAGQQVLALARDAVDALTADYLLASRSLREWDRRRSAARDALADLARADDVRRFAAVGGWIEVHRVESVTLPKAHTPARDALDTKVRALGLWDRAAQLNARLLYHALRRLPPEQADTLTAICTIETVYRLVSHDQGVQDADDHDGDRRP